MKISPTDFEISLKDGSHEIQLINLYEAICQGGPTIGELELNGKTKFHKAKFGGGPFVVYGETLLIPELFNSFFKGQYFKLAAINLETLEKKHISSKEKMILISSIINNRVKYFTDIQNTTLSTSEIIENT